MLTIDPNDKFLIVRVSDFKVVQTESSKEKAEHAIDIMNKHNEKYNHTERYRVIQGE